jgi:hypothetical protein
MEGNGNGNVLVVELGGGERGRGLGGLEACWMGIDCSGNSFSLAGMKEAHGRQGSGAVILLAQSKRSPLMTGREGKNNLSKREGQLSVGRRRQARKEWREVVGLNY